jgi:hypothetical protein
MSSSHEENSDKPEAGKGNPTNVRRGAEFRPAKNEKVFIGGSCGNLRLGVLILRSAAVSPKNQEKVMIDAG